VDLLCYKGRINGVGDEYPIIFLIYVDRNVHEDFLVQCNDFGPPRV
jgi:hypothetical protein